MSGPSQIGSVDQLQQFAESIKSSAADKAGTDRTPFADLIKDFVADTNVNQVEAHQSVKDLVSGDANSIHDVVMTASKAELAFRLMMEIRNKLINSYQEIIRMQV